MEFKCYQNTLGTQFAVRDNERTGKPAICCRSLGVDNWLVSGVMAPEVGNAKTAEELQAALDRVCEAKGWAQIDDEDAEAMYNDPLELLDDKQDGAAPALLAAAVAASKSPAPSDNARLAQQPSTILPAFDFGADDGTNSELMQCAQMFMAGRYAQVMAVKRAHDLTANNRNGAFGKWCEAVGISRDTGNNMTVIAEKFGNIQMDDGTPLIEAMPKTLLYAAAKSSNEDVVDAVKSGDITTMQEYRDKMAEIEALASQNRALLDSNASLLARTVEERKRAEAAEQQRKNLQEAEAAHVAKIRELEARPVDVAVQQPTQAQIDAAAGAKIKEATAMLQAQIKGLQQDLDEAQRADDDAIAVPYETLAEFGESTADGMTGLWNAFLKVVGQADDNGFVSAAEPIVKVCHGILENFEE